MLDKQFSEAKYNPERNPEFKDLPDKEMKFEGKF